MPPRSARQRAAARPPGPCGGAEALLGAGDMLFSDRGGAPQRFHGCYVDEEEIQRVVSFLKTQARPVYNLDILKPRDEEGEGGG